MESTAAYSLISSSLIKTSSPYVLINKKDSLFSQSVKQVSGVVVSSALVLAGTVETVVYGLLAFLTKIGHFLLLKNSDFSLKLDHSILQPLVTRSLMAAGNVAIAASRAVTNFQGAESVANTDQAIREKCNSFAHADFMQKIRHLHINGFDSKSPTHLNKKEELAPSTPITTPSSAPTKWHLERKYILMGIGLLAASLLAYKVYEYYSLAAILPEPTAMPTSSPGNTPVEILPTYTPPETSRWNRDLLVVPSQLQAPSSSSENSQPSASVTPTLPTSSFISLQEKAQQNLISISRVNTCPANGTHGQEIHPATEESSSLHFAAMIGISATLIGISPLLMQKLAFCFSKKSSIPSDQEASFSAEEMPDLSALQAKTPPTARLVQTEASEKVTTSSLTSSLIALTPEVSSPLATTKDHSAQTPPPRGTPKTELHLGSSSLGNNPSPIRILNFSSPTASSPKQQEKLDASMAASSSITTSNTSFASAAATTLPTQAELQPSAAGKDPLSGRTPTLQPILPATARRPAASSVIGKENISSSMPLMFSPFPSQTAATKTPTPKKTSTGLTRQLNAIQETNLQELPLLAQQVANRYLEIICTIMESVDSTPRKKFRLQKVYNRTYGKIPSSSSTFFLSPSQKSELTSLANPAELTPQAYSELLKTSLQQLPTHFTTFASKRILKQIIEGLETRDKI